MLPSTNSCFTNVGAPTTAVVVDIKGDDDVAGRDTEFAQLSLFPVNVILPELEGDNVASLILTSVLFAAP